MILFNFFKRELPKLEVYCRKCGKWHPVIYGKSKGKETNLLMASKCGSILYLCGVAGKPIDGHIIRPAEKEITHDR